MNNMKKGRNILKTAILVSTVTALSIALPACKGEKEDDTIETAAAFNLTEAKKEIEAANRNFMEVLSKSDSLGLANCYTTDAKFMGPNGPAVAGRQNIQQVVAGIIRSGATKLDLKIIDLWGNEEMLAEEGELTLGTKDGKQLDKGKYIVLWKKEEGKWKLFRDCFNSDLPAPTSK